MATALKNLSEAIGHVPSGKNRRIAIIVAEWNHEITFALQQGAQDYLVNANTDEVLNFTVPGCFELPFAAQSVLESNGVDAVICLGCVIQGDTPHFDYVCKAVTDGILRVGLDTGIPIIFGVLTVNTLEQAQDRAGGKHGNKGVEAAITALKMTQYLLK